MQNDNAVRVDSPTRIPGATKLRRSSRYRPYTHFARSGPWRFRSSESAFRPFKPFRFE